MSARLRPCVQCGELTPDNDPVEGLSDSTPILCRRCDEHAALYAAACFVGIVIMIGASLVAAVISR